MQIIKIVGTVIDSLGALFFFFFFYISQGSFFFVLQGECLEKASVN